AISSGRKEYGARGAFRLESEADCLKVPPGTRFYLPVAQRPSKPVSPVAGLGVPSVAGGSGFAAAYCGCGPGLDWPAAAGAGGAGFAVAIWPGFAAGRAAAVFFSCETDPVGACAPPALSPSDENSRVKKLPESATRGPPDACC